MDLTSSEMCSSGSEYAMTSTSFMVGSPSSSAKLSTLLLFLLRFQDISAVITNVSVIQSWRWFFHLSAFESVFLAFIIAKVFALSVLGILPINITEFWHGSSAGRRKKRRVATQFSPPPHVAQATKEIGFKLLNLYTKLDQNQCGFRALCELQSKVICGNYDKQQLPQVTQLVLTTFLSYADQEQPFMTTEPKNEEETKGGSSSVDINLAVRPYAEAIKIGSQPETFYTQIYGNATNKQTTEYENACHRKYPVCPVTSDELMEYIERINMFEY